MASNSHPSVSLTRKQAAFLLVAWLFIGLKCVFVAWAVPHWQLPFAAGWLIYPTVAFGVLATGLWLIHRGDED